MPAQVFSAVENNFTKGLLTEFSGLNFPENAATDTDNCVYTLVGDVTRRQGIDYEANCVFNNIGSFGAVNTYKWNNAGGDGLTQMVVTQSGGTLFFYVSTNATVTNGLSHTLLTSVLISGFAAPGITFDQTIECQFSDGNGYLFVYHPNCDPFYCTFANNTVTATTITLQIRDFIGVKDNLDPTVRPQAPLSQEHFYNLLNQGWVAGSPWNAHSGANILATTGVITWQVEAGLPIQIGNQVTIANNHDAFPGGTYQPSLSPIMSGSVTGYNSTSGVVTIDVTTVSPIWNGVFYSDWNIYPTSTGFINTFFNVASVYPANSDVWWYFKDNTDTFNPAATIGNVTLNTANAPQGHFIMNVFTQQRTLLSTIQNLTDVITTARPRIGTWFQGRVWYAGVDAQQPATGDVSTYSWTESIYFSQTITDPSQFGKCYQTNDPTSETLFDLLPTDGGVIQIQGCGSIYKLFAMQNALLVFAANGVWYVTGSQGIGFSANDYTIVKLSSVRSISSSSFVDIQGLPMFWNEEGIYQVTTAKQGPSLLGTPLHVNPLEVEPLTVGTILTFYNSIPLQSKKFARGDYDPINYVVQWLYKSTNETSSADRYNFDKIMNLNTYNSAFYPYTIPANPLVVQGINYIAGPGGSQSPLPVFKYLTYTGQGTYTFSEENSDTYTDFASSGTPINFDSYFVTGYKLHGQGQKRFQIPYIYVFSRADTATSYTIQGLWDYAISGVSGRWSVAQVINNYAPNFGMIFHRHKIRGRGIVLQIKVKSVDGQPFDIMGWSTFETVNTGI